MAGIVSIMSAAQSLQSSLPAYLKLSADEFLVDDNGAGYSQCVVSGTVYGEITTAKIGKLDVQLNKELMSSGVV